MKASAEFFHEHAGFAYMQGDTEDQKAQARVNQAENLAWAIARAAEEGYSFEWSIDPEGDLSKGDIEHDGPFWQVLLRDPQGNVQDSLGGVDFGDNGSPWGDPYRRVCEAEMALGVFTRDAPNPTKAA